MNLETFYAQAEAGEFGAGYVTHKLIGDDLVAEFVPMPDGPFTVHFELVEIKGAKIQIAKGRYLTPEEVAEKEANDAAEAVKSAASIKARELELAIQALAPQLLSAFMTLTEDEQADFAPVFDSAEKRLGMGDVNGAKRIIARAKPDTDNGIAVQAAMVAELESLLVAMGA